MEDSTFQAWLCAQDRVVVPLPNFLTPADGAILWTRPKRDELKINVDATNILGAETYGFASIARDHLGVVVEAFSVCRSGVIRPELGEAMDVREALSWIKRRGWTNVRLETDSLMVFQGIRSHVVMISYFGSVIEECKGLLNDLGSIGVYFVKRCANEVANALAKSCSVVAKRILAREEIPSIVLDVIVKERYQ